MSLFFFLFLKPENRMVRQSLNKTTMDRNTIFAMVAALMLCFGACTDNVSKEYKAMDEEITTIETKINEITDCDELKMMYLTILGLQTDMENYRGESVMSDVEIGKLNDKIDQLEAVWNGKCAALGCEGNLIENEFDTSGEEAGDFDYNIL